jgi:Ser/Thr protein kinase RdoA (MazF antagonist)
VRPDRRSHSDFGAGRAKRLAEAALERYGLRDARLHLLRSGFKQVFHVESPTGEEFALRMYGVRHAVEGAARPDDPRLRTSATLRSPETLRAQLSWLMALGRETGLLVPEPVAALDGSLVGCASVEGVPGARRFALVRWVPGRNKKEDLSPADLSLAGSFVALLHGYAERYPVPEVSAFPRWDWHWPFGESAPVWSEGEAFYSADQMAVFEEAARRVRQDLEELGYGSDVFGVVHRDLGLDNLLFHDGIVGAIDFDLCGLGHYLLDLTATLGSLRPVHVDRIEQMQEALLEGYERERSLHPEHQRYFITFTVMQRVAIINRQLQLLASGTTGHEVRDRRYLHNWVRWIRRNYL